MINQKKVNPTLEETHGGTEQDNEEISVNTKTFLIREFFDGVRNVRELYRRIDELDEALEDFIQLHKLSKPIENGCIEFERIDWINRGDRGWNEAVKQWNKHNNPKIEI